MNNKMLRCPWNYHDEEIYIKYHDEEWGRPTYDDRSLFEILILEGAQAGLSWITILKRREAYRRAFDNFDVEKVAAYTEEDKKRLLADSGIIRNRLKINSAIRNAKIFINIQKEFGSFSQYIWAFVDGKPIVSHLTDITKMPAKTELAEKISKDLKKRGMNFVGPVVIYSYMQSVGIVNDHLETCPFNGRTQI